MNSKFAAIFRRYPGKAASSLLFPGCYFPAFFPRASRVLCELAAQQGASCAFDCCGKPQQQINPHIAAQLPRLQVQELITVCPNCHAHLQGRLSVPLRTIYEKLAEWGVSNQHAAAGQVFIPCPDNYRQEHLRQIRHLLPNYHLEPIEAVPCCGLSGGLAGDKVKARQLSTKVKQQQNGILYTYCASCAGQFQRQGVSPVRHLLAEVLGVNEAPDTAHSLYNRWQGKKIY